MESFVKELALKFSLGVELIAVLVVGIGLLQFLYYYIPSIIYTNHHLSNARLRVKFGSSLTIALELMLAADILQTAVAPTWDEIGKLASIATIRTVLNFFLAKELKDLEKREVTPGN
ncbi:MAG TPA: DUF1622 domain-containing protein [Flavisolibacter sp.]|jgi:uncharacterized membrane protein|nr:DUF1622 domain-containing protein [Flavisolibacter sp.]HZH99680.1 DUF1622 domain-containing protein [Flavisolibacter sp.]